MFYVYSLCWTFAKVYSILPHCLTSWWLQEKKQLAQCSVLLICRYLRHELYGLGSGAAASAVHLHRKRHRTNVILFVSRHLLMHECGPRFEYGALRRPASWWRSSPSVMTARRGLVPSSSVGFVSAQLSERTNTAIPLQLAVIFTQ